MRDGPLYRKENLVLNVGGETVHIDCPERFAWLLDDKLGGDAADYFRDTVTNLCFDLDLSPVNVTAPMGCKSTIRMSFEMHWTCWQMRRSVNYAIRGRVAGCR